MSRVILLLMFVLLVVACVDTTGVYRVEFDEVACPVPAPVINDPQPPSSIALGCPYQVRLADSSLVTVYFQLSP